MDPEKSDALLRRAAQFESIVQNAVDAVITINASGIIQSVNPATQRLFGYAAEDVIGQNVRMLMPSPYQEEHDSYIANYQTSGVAKIIGIGREVIGKRQDGTTFPMHLAVSEIIVNDQRLFTGIVRDITDLKRAQEELSTLNEELEQRVRERTSQLEEAQTELIRKEKFAALGQVAGGIAHEIRNPLNAIKTSAYYLLHARNPTAEKTIEHLERIDRQVTLADNVITALSDFAKLPEPECHPVDVRALLRSVIASTTLPADVEVTLDVADATPQLLIDNNQIPIVFRNLLRNARDAIQGAGTINLAAEPCANHVKITVTDSGEGIDSETAEQILEPLFTTKARGMGLGLPISRAIVEKHHGTLQMTSEVGKGSTFSVTLPIATDSHEGDKP